MLTAGCTPNITNEGDTINNYYSTSNEDILKWSLQQKISVSEAADNDYFGHSVSISGDYAIIGAKNIEF